MMLMAVAALASCEKQNTLNEPDAQKGTYTYTLSATAPEMEDVNASGAAQAPTRTDYDNEGHFSWSAGDAISVLFHNGATNKFFTLTTTGSGTTASFSGEIEAGYEIGASDGTVSDKKIWALFPASTNHTFQRNKANTADSVRFYVQPSVDFTATHFSANIPMYDLVAAEDAMLSFKNMASTYKFIVTGIKDGVDKVTFRVHNQQTHALSGSWPIHSGEIFVNYDYASPGSANSTLTYVSSVTSNQAVFYVSSRYYGKFQPMITVSNYATGIAIKTFTATKIDTPAYMNRIQPITLDVSEANGGVYFAPAITIDGDLSDWDGISVLPSANTGRIREWKFKSDAEMVYFYLKLRGEKVATTKNLYVGIDTDNDSGTQISAYAGDMTGCEAVAKIVPAAADDPLTLVNGFDPNSRVYHSNGSSTSGTVKCMGYIDSGEVYIELSIPRSELGIPAAGNTVTVGCSYEWNLTGNQSIELE